MSEQWRPAGRRLEPRRRGRVLLAEPARAKLLLALVDGRSLAASVLAAEAGVAASTASHYLARLLEAGLLTVVSRGRHRYFTLAGPQVAELIEAVARVAPPQPTFPSDSAFGCPR